MRFDRDLFPELYVLNMQGDDHYYVNQEGKTVPADLPRVDFSHWVLVDIDSSTT